MRHDQRRARSARVGAVPGLYGCRIESGLKVRTKTKQHIDVGTTREAGDQTICAKSRCGCVMDCAKTERVIKLPDSRVQRDWRDADALFDVAASRPCIAIAHRREQSG